MAIKTVISEQKNTLSVSKVGDKEVVKVGFL